MTVVVNTTAQLVCTGSNPAHGMLEIQHVENL